MKVKFKYYYKIVVLVFFFSKEQKGMLRWLENDSKPFGAARVCAHSDSASLPRTPINYTNFTPSPPAHNIYIKH